jgi:nucleoside-diphosphate-sugar epimerase
MKTALIVGATGFIGKHLVKSLSKKYKTICLVRSKSNPEDIKFLKQANARIIYGDLDNPESITGIANNTDVIFYLAGGGEVGSLSENDFKKLQEYNLKTLKNFIESAGKIKKLVFFSSISAIGIHPGSIINEKTNCTPVIPHEKCKLEAEEVIKKSAKQKGFNYIIIRPSIVYGEYSFGDSYKMIKMINNGRFFMPGSGNNITPWIYVDNLVDATIIASEKSKNEIFIINGEERISFKEIVNFVSKQINKKVLFVSVPLFLVKPGVFLLEKLYLLFNKSPPINMYRLKSMTTDRIYSISKINSLGYKEKTNFRDSMAKTIGWYKKNGYL